MPWISLALAQAQMQLDALARERQETSRMTPDERSAYYARKEASRKAWEAEQSKKAEEAALAAEQEEIANKTYRNPEHDLYDPLRVLLEQKARDKTENDGGILDA